MPIRQLIGVLDAGIAPSRAELLHALLHGDRHLDAGERVLLYASGLRIAEEDHDGVAHVLVDRGAVLQRDPRHLGQVLIEQLRDVLQFHPVGGLGEPGDVGEEHGELLALAGELHLLPALEDRGVDLRRQVLRELARQDLQLAVLAADLLGRLLGAPVGFLERRSRAA